VKKIIQSAAIILLGLIISVQCIPKSSKKKLTYNASQFYAIMDEIKKGGGFIDDLIEAEELLKKIVKRGKMDKESIDKMKKMLNEAEKTIHRKEEAFER